MAMPQIKLQMERVVLSPMCVLDDRDRYDFCMLLKVYTLTAWDDRKIYPFYVTLRTRDIFQVRKFPPYYPWEEKCIAKQLWLSRDESKRQLPAFAKLTLFRRLVRWFKKARQP